MFNRNKIDDICVLTDDEDDFESSHGVDKYTRIKYDPMMFSKESVLV